MSLTSGSVAFPSHPTFPCGLSLVCCSRTEPLICALVSGASRLSQCVSLSLLLFHWLLLRLSYQRFLNFRLDPVDCRAQNQRGFFFHRKQLCCCVYCVLKQWQKTWYFTAALQCFETWALLEELPHILLWQWCNWGCVCVCVWDIRYTLVSHVLLCGLPSQNIAFKYYSPHGL